jgi:hypothetical protein
MSGASDSVMAQTTVANGGGTPIARAEVTARQEDGVHRILPAQPAGAHLAQAGVGLLQLLQV